MNTPRNEPANNRNPITMGLADIHIHSSYSDGLGTPAEILDYVEGQTELSVIAIVDHDEIAGSHATHELAARRNSRVEVVVGMEVTTLEGHLLALFIEQPVPSLRPLEHTIENVHAQGGLCIVPHPMSWATRSIGRFALERILRRHRDRVYFDALEAVNATLAGRVAAKAAARLNAKRLHLPEVGGSDAHFVESIGSGYTVFEGTTAEDLRRSILAGTVRSGGGQPVRLLQIGLGKVVRQQARGLFVLPLRLLYRTLYSRTPGR